MENKGLLNNWKVRLNQLSFVGHMKNENLYLFKFAWKSIRRNAGRSFFIGFSVSLAVTIAVWVMAFFDGMNAQIEKAVVNTNTGFFQIQEEHYAQSTDSAYPALFDEHLKKKLSLPGISAVSPELVLDANTSTPEGSAGLVAIGIVPELHRDLLPLPAHIVQGEFIDQDEYGVVIGQELARLFKFQVGDQLVLNYQDQQGELRSELLNIQGIYHYNSQGFEKKFIYLNQSTWQKLFLNNDKGEILFNRITLLTSGLEYRPQLEDIIKDSNFSLKSWKDMNPEMAVVLDFHDGMIKFFFLIIAITITMTILTPVNMLWQERLKELRMMNVIGVTKHKFWKIGFSEVFLMILLSGMLSVFFLVTIIGIQSQTGLDFKNLSDGIPIERAGIKLPAVIYPLLSGEQLLITFIFVILVLGFSYVFSIHRTLKKLESEA